MSDAVLRFFHNATIWNDTEVAASLVDLSDCLDEDGGPGVDKIYGIANDLVETKPYLKASKDSPRSDLPNGPTGVAVGSGRRRYGRPVANAATLRAKYRMDA